MWLVRSQLYFPCRARVYVYSTRYISTNTLNSSSNPKTPRTHSHDNVPFEKNKSQPRNLLEGSKLQAHLDLVNETQNKLTLDDLIRLRPLNHSPALSPKYEVEYNQLLDRLQRSFTKSQLKYFLTLYPGVGNPSKYARKKSGYATRIIEEAWGWPSLSEIQKAKRDASEVEVKTFPMDPRQSFMILGKDGSRLLSLSLKHRVYISFSANPLALKAEGLRVKLEKLSKHIAAAKEQIREEFFTIPSKKSIRPDLLQRISRISGAFTENFGEGQIRISYDVDEPRPAFVAKRLATYAACYVEELPPPVLTHVPAGVPISSPVPLSVFPHNYALYPFLSARSLPWTLNAGGAFRTRRVGEWIALEKMGSVGEISGLASGHGQILDVDENEISLKQFLLGKLPPETAGNSRVVTASLGHMLFAPPAAPRQNITPPLDGAGPLSRVLSWMRESSAARLFSTSLPASLLDSPPRQQKIIHRLMYQTVPTDTPPKILQFELYISLSNQDLHGEAGIVSEVNSSSKETLSLSHGCRSGTESVLDLMMPDRPMDIRFSVFDSSVVSEQAFPPELNSYVQELAAFLQSPNSHQLVQPDTPLILQYDNTDYILRSSASVRQNAEVVASDQPVQVLTESILDLEVNEKATTCKVICTKPTSNESWESFMRNCDHLTSS